MGRENAFDARSRKEKRVHLHRSNEPTDAAGSLAWRTGRGFAAAEPDPASLVIVLRDGEPIHESMLSSPRVLMSLT